MSKKFRLRPRLKLKFRSLLFDKISTTVLAKYFNYSNVFSIENIIKLPKHSKIIDYAIELKKDKQLFFKLIYSLKLVKLKILKTYIKTNLANNFI